MSGVTNRQAGEAAQAVAPRSFIAQLEPRLRRLVEDGSLPRGSVWCVRVIEVGESINGVTYTKEAVRDAAAIFEGCPVRIYSWRERPDDPDADHVPELVQEVAGGFLVGNDIGALEGCHFNEEAQALDAYLKVYDEKVRGRMVEAFDLGDIGEGANRDVFGFSIDARGDTAPDSDSTVTRFTQANELTMVRDPAAGGRVRRLVASVTRSKVMPKNVKLAESTKRLTEAMSELEAAARLKALFSEARDQLWEALEGPEDVAAKAQKIASIATQLAEATVGEAPAETMQEAVMFREAAATFAGKLKLMADALSAAPDDEALEVLEAIRGAVEAAVAEQTQIDGEAAEAPPGEPTPGAQEGEDMAKEDAAAQAQTDEFARMSAGVTEALKNENLDPKVRAKLIEALGHEPNETPEQAENRELKKKLREQAIRFEFNRILAEGVKVHDTDMVFGMLDRASIKVAEDHSVTGVQEALDAVLEGKPFLKVVEADPPPTPPKELTPEEIAAAEAEAAEAAAKVQEGVDPPAAAAGAETPLAAGVTLRESIKPATRPTITDAKKARLQQRCLGGDASAMTELRLARGHRW